MHVVRRIEALGVEHVHWMVALRMVSRISQQRLLKVESFLRLLSEFRIFRVALCLILVGS